MGSSRQAARRGSESEKRSRTKSRIPPLGLPTSSIQGMSRDRQQTEGREAAIGGVRGPPAGMVSGKPGDFRVKDGRRKGQLDTTRTTSTMGRKMPTGSGDVEVTVTSHTD